MDSDSVGVCWHGLCGIGMCVYHARCDDLYAKIFKDDQTLKMLAARRQVLASKIGKIKSSEVHEVFGVREAKQTNLSVSVSPTAGGLVSPLIPSMRRMWCCRQRLGLTLRLEKHSIHN